MSQKLFNMVSEALTKAEALEKQVADAQAAIFALSEAVRQLKEKQSGQQRTRFNN